MRFPVWACFALVSGFVLNGAPARAQTAPPAETLHKSPEHPPAGPRRDQSVKPPAAAPREPVHAAEHGGGAKTPVVPPRGQIHPHRPASAAPMAKALPAPVQPEMPVPKPAPADKVLDPEKPEGTAAKLPRFVSLRSDDVNMRAGPGTRYRIDWVYKRRDLPVEIEREFDVWRWVRDAEGTQGWVHRATLMDRRSYIIQKNDATLRSSANDAAAAVAVLKVGVIGRIRSCEAGSDWCNVQAGSYRGYLRREQFWGVLPDEAVNP